MDDKDSKIYIDPFKFPSDGEIKNKWDRWKEQEGNPCKTAAIKWLQCMGFVKELYPSGDGDVNDGAQWHKFMLNKCYVPYTDYHECRIDEREAKFERMRAEVGEEKHQQSVEQVKATLGEKVGKEAAEQIWNYREGYNERFKALRRQMDDELGVIRNGQEVPEWEKPATLAEKPMKPKDASQVQDPGKTPEAEKKADSKFKGWWSQPESRFKKGGESED